MLNSLYKGLSEESKKVLASQAKECSLLVRQLQKHLIQKQSLCEKHRKARKCYFMPAWKEYQADCNGYLRALDETLEALQSISDPEE